MMIFIGFLRYFGAFSLILFLLAEYVDVFYPHLWDLYLPVIGMQKK